jgi:hypothetical protein
MDHANCPTIPQASSPDPQIRLASSGPAEKGVVQLTITATKSVLDPRAALTIRVATAVDAPALHRLAALDSTRYDGGDALVAEVGDEIWAAVSLTGTGALMADPFRPSSELLAMLVERARQLRTPDPAPRRLRRAFAQRARRARPAT